MPHEYPCRWPIPVFLLVILITFASVGHAMIEAPYARIFASKSGRVGVKVVPGPRNDTATAVAFALARDGTERVLWRRDLPNVPDDVEVFEFGLGKARGGKGADEVYVVTLDTWGRAGGEHALVVYGPGGKTLHDLKPADLVPPPANPPVAPADGGTAWREGATLTVDAPSPQAGPTLQLSFPDGQIAAIALPSGPVKRAARSPGSAQPAVTPAK